MSETDAAYARAKQSISGTNWKAIIEQNNSIEELVAIRELMVFAEEAAAVARTKAEKMVRKLMRMSQEDWEEYRRNMPPTQNTLL